MNRHPTIAELAGLEELTRRRRTATRDHLAECPSCRRDLAFTREVRDRAREATGGVPAPETLARILARRAAGDRVILPTDLPAAAPRRHRYPAIAAAVLILAAAAVAAQLVFRNGRAPSPAPTPAAPESRPPVGVSIVPNGAAADIRIHGAATIHVEVVLHDGAELSVRGHGAAAEARFRTAGNGITVSEVRGGAIELRIPRGVTSRLFVNERLELTADGRSLRIERSGAVRDRVVLDLGN